VNSPAGFGHRQVGERAEEVPLTSDRPDGELIAGSRAEPAMFSEIFDRHHRELYRYLRHRVGAELAADLAAETFVIAFGRPGAYRPEGTDDPRRHLAPAHHPAMTGPRTHACP
jgi:Sigma-70 region 2